MKHTKNISTSADSVPAPHPMGNGMPSRAWAERLAQPLRVPERAKVIAFKLGRTPTAVASKAGEQRISLRRRKRSLTRRRLREVPNGNEATRSASPRRPASLQSSVPLKQVLLRPAPHDASCFKRTLALSLLYQSTAAERYGQPCRRLSATPKLAAFTSAGVQLTPQRSSDPPYSAHSSFGLAHGSAAARSAPAGCPA